MRKLKGQINVFEQVMLFLISVLIFLACLMAFSSYQQYFISTGNSDQLVLVRDYIAYSIIKASEAGNETESYTTLYIPKVIGSETYIIRLSPAGLTLDMPFSKETKSTNLYGIGSSMELGTSDVSSSYGRVILYKDGNKIIIT